VGGDLRGGFDAPDGGDVARGGGGLGGGVEEGLFGDGGGFGVGGGDESGDVVGFEEGGEGRGVGVVYGEDTRADFFFFGGGGLRGVRIWGGVGSKRGICTSRARTRTSFFPSAMRASTMARPRWPVPPATATTGMMVDWFESFEFGEGEGEGEYEIRYLPILVKIRGVFRQ